ncbi:MAG: efflux RND transporter periplasmic adaptor subunit [Candidatus Scalindua sp.]|nr:efflux RND transporter periplasmic adaptor subunit [Candidatus Scalindua sp.]
MEGDDLSKLRIERTTYQAQHKNRKRFLSILIVSAVFAGGGIFYAAGILTPAIKVKVTSLTTIYPSQTFTLMNASGYVEAQRKSALSSKITSWLVELFVEEGNIVKKGEIIATLENGDILTALDKAKANIEVARFERELADAELVEATLAFNRTRELLEEKVVSLSEFDVAEARYKTAFAAVSAKQAVSKAVEAALKEVEVSLEYTFIRAPFDAVVLTKNADIGDIITPLGAAANVRASVVTIADMDSLLVEVDVSESNIEQVKTGQHCEIRLDAFSHDRYRGKVHMIVPTADRSKASVQVKIAFIDKDSRVIPEMSAKVAFLNREIRQDEQKPLRALPVSAFIRDKGHDSVYVVENNRAREKRVETGRSLGSMVEILSGLEEGDRVVLSPTRKIKDEKKVKISEE